MAASSITCAGPAEQPEEGLPPSNDLDAEGVILSHCFVAGTQPNLHPRHFYSKANGCIYGAMLSVVEDGQHPDLVTVARKLRDLGLLKVVGGSSYLATLCHAQPATAYPEQHVEAIREMYRRRVLGDVALEVRVKLRAGELRAADAWAFFKRRCDEVNADNADT